jgi:fatty acid desaturase
MTEILPREPAVRADNARDLNTRDNSLSVAAIASGRIETDENVWTRRLVLFLRVMAVLAVLKGLYHWAQVTGFVGGEDDAFEVQPLAWQTATVYFAVIELVAAVGMWLATPWGAVVWLTAVVSMAVIEVMFPAIYGGNLLIAGIEVAMLSAYLALAWMAARERPP